MSVSMTMIINIEGTVTGSNGLDPAVSWATLERTEGPQLAWQQQRGTSQRKQAAFCRVTSCNFCQLGVESVVQCCIILLKATRCDSTASGGTKCKTSILCSTTESRLLLEFARLVLVSLDAYHYDTQIATPSTAKWSPQKHSRAGGGEVKMRRTGNTAEVLLRKPGRRSGFHFSFQTTGK